MLTPKQIAWAATHDWFVRDLGTGRIIIRDDITGEHIIWTESFKELRDWAGY